MGSLRTQIIETQKVRSDLMKWKLLLVAGLGIVGLGLETNNNVPRYPLLCLVPFVCVYVDALCAHLSLRIRVIGAFLSEEEPHELSEKSEHKYERFLRFSKTQFRLETLALHWSTVLLSMLVGGSSFPVPTLTAQPPSEHAARALAVSGSLGILLTLVVWVFHYFKEKAIKLLVKKWKEQEAHAEQSLGGDSGEAADGLTRAPQD